MCELRQRGPDYSIKISLVKTKKLAFLHYMKKLIFLVTSQWKTNHVFVFVVLYSDNTPENFIFLLGSIMAPSLSEPYSDF